MTTKTHSKATPAYDLAPRKDLGGRAGRRGTKHGAFTDALARPALVRDPGR